MSTTKLLYNARSEDERTLRAICSSQGLSYELVVGSTSRRPVIIKAKRGLAKTLRYNYAWSLRRIAKAMNFKQHGTILNLLKQ